jgi:hypothetical protein
MLHKEGELMKILIVALVLTLAGCGNTNVGTSSLVEEKIRLSDGRVIICVIWDGYYAGNVTCDWDHPVSDIGYPLEDEKR